MIAEGEQQKCVLILGGSDFMGKTLGDFLDQENYRVCCINRGKVHWYRCP